MKFQPTSLALTLAAAIASLAALPVTAAPLTMTTAPISFSGSASVTDVQGGGAATRNSVDLGSSSIQQFDAAQGVLLGARLNVTGTQTQTTQVMSTDGADNGNNDRVTSNGSGSSSVAISAVGVSNTFNLITQGASCTGNRLEACAGTASSIASATNWVGSVSADSLGSYVGTSGIDATRRAATLTARQADNAFTGDESTTSTVTWAGSLSATYEYLLHADPTFGVGGRSLTLDFGDVFLGSGTAQRGFSIVNATGNRVGLDLDSFSSTGDVSQLYADLTGFSALAAGSSAGFFASFNTTALGSFTTSYTLNLSDADIGAANSRSAYTMTLNLKGNVVAARARVSNDVPEPGMLALASVGLLGLALTRRRYRLGAASNRSYRD
jgi:hypothetical protein